MAKIKLRRDLAATWTSTNPTLAAGEPGYETDTKKIKYGDGTTAWTSLGYAIPTFTIGTEGAASGDGGLAYNQTTGVLTYTPPAYIGLTGISVGTDAVASGDGGIAYDNTTGVFTYTPPTALGIGAVSLTAISVGAEAAAALDGGIAYNNTTGVFTYTPPDLSALIVLSSISVGAEAAASGNGGVAYDNATGVFTYTPPDQTKIANGAHEIAIASSGLISFPNNKIELATSNPLVIKTVSGNTFSETTSEGNSWESFVQDYTGTNVAWSLIRSDLTNLAQPSVLIENKRSTDGVEYRWTFGSDGNLAFPGKATFGTGSDLQIYHDGTDSYINDAGTGNLKIAASQIDLLGGTDGAETMATFVDNGAVTLYHDNAIKIATTSTGVNVTGSLIVNGSEDLADAGAASLALNASYFTTVAAETATLAAGTEGQIKTFMMAGSAGNMVITVTNPGWGGAGTITFSAVGQGCILQYVNSKWFCIGNNGAAFA